MDYELIAREIVDTAIRVHTRLAIELKSVQQLLPVHKAQLLSYLRAGDYRLGFLLNFQTMHMRDGIKRVVNLGARSPIRIRGCSQDWDLALS